MADEMIRINCHGRIWVLKKEDWLTVLKKLSKNEMFNLSDYGTEYDYDISSMTPNEATKLLERT